LPLQTGDECQIQYGKFRQTLTWAVVKKHQANPHTGLIAAILGSDFGAKEQTAAKLEDEVIATERHKRCKDHNVLSEKVLDPNL